MRLMDVETCRACRFSKDNSKQRIRIGVVEQGALDTEDIEKCILPELQALRDMNIETTCSCCGHGFPDEAFIVVDAADRQKMLDLGYEERGPKYDHCVCGVFFKAKMPYGSIPADIEEYPYIEGVNKSMFDVKPIVSPKPTDCGATCLKMLLNYYGIDVPLDDLIIECRTGIVGATMKNILAVGRNHGLNMKPYKCDADDVLNADRPCICWWKYTHFVVCCGRDEEGKVVICNPDKGRYRMSYGTFKSFFTDICAFIGEPEDLPTEE